MKTKRFVIFIFLILVVLSIVGALLLHGLNSTTTTTNTIKIGVSVYKGSDAFISSMMQDLQDIVGLHGESGDTQIHISIVDATENQTTQNKQVDRFISLEYDVLVVNLVERAEASYIIDKAMNADIPVIFFNREPVSADMQKWNRLFYVGSDAHESARLQAEIIINRYNKDPDSIDMNGDGVIQYIMLEGESRHQDAVIRTEESVQTLRDAGLVLERVDSGVANWDRNQADAIITRIFSENSNAAELIICNNDDMAIGAIGALERLGLEFNNVVGIDGTDYGTAAVDSGKMLGTVEASLSDHAQTIFDMAYALATGADVYKTASISANRTVRIPMRIYIRQEDMLDQLEEN